MENETKKEPVENKQNWFKAHAALCIICLVVIVAAVVGVYFLMQNQGTSPEKVAENYVAAMNEGSADKIIEITDLKGAYVWDNCGKDASKFIDEYNKTSDVDVNAYKDKLKNSLDSAMAMLKAFGGVKVTLQNVETPEELANGLYKVKANMQMEAFGMQQNQSITLVTYNGKYIGEMSEE